MLRSRSRRIPRVLLPAAVVLGVSAGPSLAQGTAEQREACTPDALKLCQDTIPDVAKTEACMKRHEAELSARCRAVFAAPPAATEPRRAARAAPEDRDRLADPRERRAARGGPAGEEADVAPRRRRPPEAEARDADRGGPPDDDDAAPGTDRFGPPGPDRRFAGGGPPDPYDDPPWPGPRGYGPPGYGPPGPYGGRFAEQGPPDGADGPGPRAYGPPDRDDGRFADRGPPDGGAPDIRRYHYGPPEADDPGPRGRRPARRAIRRLCAQGMIDPRTCALVRRALAEGR